MVPLPAPPWAAGTVAGGPLQLQTFVPGLATFCGTAGPHWPLPLVSSPVGEGPRCTWASGGLHTRVLTCLTLPSKDSGLSTTSNIVRLLALETSLSAHPFRK